MEVEVKGHADTHCCNTSPFYCFILTLHVSTDVDRRQAFSTNPQNQGKILLFVRSVKYDNMRVCLVDRTQRDDVDVCYF